MNDLVDHSETFNTTRPRETLSWKRPRDVHSGLTDPNNPNLPEPQNLPEA